MAEILNRADVINYQLSNGETVNLIALIGTGHPAALELANDPAALTVGTVAYVCAMGDLRRGVIVKLTKTKIHVAFTTQGAVTEADRYRDGNGIRVQTTAAAHVYVVPAAPVEKVTEEPAEMDASTELAQSLIEADHAEALVMNAQWDLAETLDDILGEEPSPAAPVQDLTGSAVVRLLERVHERIRQNHPEVPQVVIVTGSGVELGGAKWGHFRAKGWTTVTSKEQDLLEADLEMIDRSVSHIHEMFMAGETLAKGSRQVLQTMLHESAHALAEHRGEQDTSRQGRWHNKTFLKTAQELGLEYRGDKANPQIGYSGVTLTDETLAEYKDLLEELDAEINLMVRLPGWLGGTTGQDGEDEGGESIGKKPTEPKAPSTSNIKCVCQCEEPNIIRMSRKVLDLGAVRCDDCDSLFHAA